jgi:hypothetical protein
MVAKLERLERAIRLGFPLISSKTVPSLWRNEAYDCLQELRFLGLDNRIVAHLIVTACDKPAADFLCQKHRSAIFEQDTYRLVNEVHKFLLHTRR